MSLTYMKFNLDTLYRQRYIAMIMKYLTTLEAARLLKVSERRIRQFCADGRLGEKIGRNYAITERQLERFRQIERKPGHP